MSDIEKIMILCGVHSEEELLEHILKEVERKRREDRINEGL